MTDTYVSMPRDRGMKRLRIAAAVLYAAMLGEQVTVVAPTEADAQRAYDDVVETLRALERVRPAP